MEGIRQSFPSLSAKEDKSCVVVCIAESLPILTVLQVSVPAAFDARIVLGADRTIADVQLRVPGQDSAGPSRVLERLAVVLRRELAELRTTSAAPLTPLLVRVCCVGNLVCSHQ